MGKGSSRRKTRDTQERKAGGFQGFFLVVAPPPVEIEIQNIKHVSGGISKSILYFDVDPETLSDLERVPPRSLDPPPESRLYMDGSTSARGATACFPLVLCFL